MTDTKQLSVIVLTLNEERHIKACLESVRDFGDELLVLDSGSLDGTVSIARELGARIEIRPFDNYAKQRNAAIAMAKAEWIFFLDADERATRYGKSEIEFRILTAETPIAGFWVPRRNIIFGKEIRHTGWSPDYQPRILRKGRGRFDPAREVHELLVWDGEAGYLKQPLLHYNYDNVAQFREKQIVYTRYEARTWFEEGKRARRRGFVGQPLREFWRRYIKLQGWRDGGHGLVLSGLMAYYAYARQKMLWDMGKEPQRHPAATRE